MDFVHIYCFWLFSFERYNGIVKSIATNNKDRFELTYMKQFVRNTQSTSKITWMAMTNNLLLDGKVARLLASSVSSTYFETLRIIMPRSYHIHQSKVHHHGWLCQLGVRNWHHQHSHQRLLDVLI
ncbi:hypothetical protein K492DRAFT_235404 [Lichtheimia hyalospora FSU 10163]|nr:hypothetical protein K492DRAFT_235404 [Lichtheimia hyalospora FSU 10163]